MMKQEDECFRFLKKRDLEALHYESLDPKVREIVRHLNQMKETWTTGSCQGHWDSKRAKYYEAQEPYLMGVTRVRDLLDLVECATQAELHISISPPIPTNRWSVGWDAEQLCRNGRLPKDTLEWWLQPKELKGPSKDLPKFQQLLACLHKSMLKN